MINHIYRPLARSLPVTCHHHPERLEDVFERARSQNTPLLGSALGQSEMLNTMSGQLPANEALYMQIKKTDETSSTDSCKPSGVPREPVEGKEDEEEVKDIVLDSNMIVRIPKDSLGISDNEILQTKQRSQNIQISNENTTVNEEGEIRMI